MTDKRQRDLSGPASGTSAAELRPVTDGKSTAARRTGDEIREIFLNFFESRDHLRIKSSSLIPEDDPTLLFVNSGMAPLKPYFTGAKKPPHPDLCNVQPCIRTRDIDDVGDRHHLTFFEMLGSWSIGRYFKERAVELAYELLVDHFGFPSERLYVSVYSGDPALNLEPDHETARAWERVGIPRDRIVFLGEDNFWGPAGDTGPCGPCTEVFYDTGDEYGPAYQSGAEFDTKRRYIEIWNAGVFMQFDKKADGTFGPLPFKSVDTGSGLERMAMILQTVQSVYETDLFTDLMDAVRGQLPAAAPLEAARTIADHVRASTFILSEGVVPANTGRSYIPRRLIRKSVALVAQSGVHAFDYRALIDVVVNRFGMHYPRLKERKQTLTDVFLQEAREFERVIGRGLERLEQLSGRPAPFVVGGRDAFDLFSTFGLPVEVTREFLKQRGASIDEEGYAREFERHQEVSRATVESAAQEWTRDATAIHALLRGRSSVFLGYDMIESDGVVLALASKGKPVGAVLAGDLVELLADRTPFYAESGGQIGDRGEIRGAGGAVLTVLDTQKVGGVTVHRAQVTSGTLREGEAIHLAVDAERRRATMANHSATHLLHAALRERLGSHVRQAGSLVEPERLRFDFQHQQRMTPEELGEVELRVNEMIRANAPQETVVTTYKDAVAAGALAFFGETYGEEVRMVRFDGFSAELCGGTHVRATGDIGQFRLLSESSIASGVRRIVAVTGARAAQHTLEQDQQLRKLAAQLKVTPAELPDRLAQLLKSKEAKPAAKPVAAPSAATSRAQTLADGSKYAVVRMDDVNPKQLQEEALRVADEISGVAIVVGRFESSARLAIAVDKRKTSTFDARRIITSLLPFVDGRGGGAPHLAQGGGPNVGGIDALIAAVPERL